MAEVRKVLSGSQGQRQRLQMGEIILVPRTSAISSCEITSLVVNHTSLIKIQDMQGPHKINPRRKY